MSPSSDALAVPGTIPTINGAPSSEGVSKAFLDEVNSQMAALVDGVSRLEAKVQAKADAAATNPKAITLEGMRDFLKTTRIDPTK